MNFPSVLSVTTRPFATAWLLSAAFLALPAARAIDQAKQEMRVPNAVTKYGVTGKDVIIGVLGRGIDWKNADFRNADGTTRIDYILDLSDNTGATAPGNTVGAGTIYTRAQINAALTNNTNLNTRDATGGGSALAGISGGGGRNNALYKGIAPEARFIIVKVASEGAAAHDGEPAETGFYNAATVFPSMQWIAAKASELKLPCVMMIDLGSMGGPTDGTGRFARQIDSFVGAGKPGLVVVTPTGNEGNVANHAAGTVNAGATISLDITKVGSDPLTFDLWYPEGDRFNVRITTPSGVSATYVAPATASASDSRTGAQFEYFHYGRDADPNGSTNAKREISIRFTGPAGSYKVELTGATIVSGRFDASLNFSADFGTGNPVSRFTTFAVPGSSIWDAATAFNILTPNSYVLQKTYTDIDGVARTAYTEAAGQLWRGSGIGPTYDGRYGVTVSLPGDSVFTTYAPKSVYATNRAAMIQGSAGLYGRMNSVAASNALMTGVVALMLQMNPTLDATEIKQIIQNTARADSFTGATPNNTWGYGKVDVLAALDLLKTRSPASTLPGVVIPPLVPVGASVVETRALTNHPDGGVLVAVSGSYAVRPNGGIASQALLAPDYTNPQPYNLSYVVRLLANGQPDPSFTSAPGGDGTVNAFAVQPADSKIVIGGTFTKFNGTLFRNLGRLKADGTADPTFNPGSGPDAQVNALAIQSNGSIVVGGAFQNFQGQSRPYLARVNAAGALESSFNPNVNGVINTIALQPDGGIVIGGAFTSVGGVARNRLARLLPSGALDTSFNPGAGANGEVVTLLVQDNLAIVAAGEFTTFAGQNRNRIVRLLSNGSIDPGFSAAASANDTIVSLGLEPAGNILLGGAFTQVNGVGRNRIARLLSTGELDPTFDPGTGANKDVRTVLPRNDGTVFLGGLFDQYQGTAVNEVVALTSTTVSTAFVQAPRSITVNPGGTARLIAEVSGPSLSYQWFKDGVAIAGATSPALTLSSVSASAQGRYTLQATSATGTVISADATVTVSGGTPGQIINLSVLTSLDTPTDEFTLGFVVGGAGTSGSKPLVVRAAGPSLAQFNVGNPLADPRLKFFANGTEAGSNDDWGGGSTLAGQMAQVGAFAFSSATSKDAALAVTTSTSANSVVVSGVGGLTGAVIAEIYDATPAGNNTATTKRLINVSLLKNIPANATLTAGFVINGSTAKTVLIRAIGPTLSRYNVGGPLSDPKLTLYQPGNDTPLATNDNWGGSSTLRDAMSALGAFEIDANSKDAALLITLQPGSYTAQATGVGPISGTALVEVYEVP